MPERNPTAKPTIIAGTVLESGTPNTGQVQYTIGGTKTFTKFSGTAGGDANIVVGGGRLDAVLLHHSAIPGASGVAIVFYDSAVAVSGGPLATSGHKIVGAISPTSTISGALTPPQVLDLGFVFTSGLCHTSASGQPGFSVSYTPVISG